MGCDFICNGVRKQKCLSHQLDFEISLMSERCGQVCGGLLQPSLMAGNKEWMRITVNALLFLRSAHPSVIKSINVMTLELLF